MPNPISELFSYLKKTPKNQIWGDFNSKDNCPDALQFVKYGLAGGLAFVSCMVVTYGVGYTIFPAFKDMLVDGVPITEELREQNYTIASVIAWVVGNFVAYVANVLWVFTAGRHSRLKEFALFTLASGLATAVGIFLGKFLIGSMGVSTHLAILANVFAAVLINYAARKFFVFKG